MANEFRVLGPPGTGKTQFLAKQVTHWAGKYHPEEMVLTSHTNAAANVLKGRIPVPPENVATLHSLAYRSLGHPEIAEKGGLAKAWNNRRIPAEWRLSEEGKPSVEDPHLQDVTEKGGVLFSIYNLVRARLLKPPHPLALRVIPFAKEWEAFKADTDSIDFMDMILRALEETEFCPGMPSVLVVDEVQDLVPAQWALVRKWGAHETVQEFVLAGDPAQVLFSFAGAGVDELLTPLPAGRERLLSRSWRLPAQIHRLAESWLSNHSGGIMTGRKYSPRAEAGEISRMDATWMAPEPVVSAVLADIAAGKTAMILASCSYILEPTVKMLRARGAPFHNPFRRQNGAWNPLHGVRPGAVGTLERLLSFLAPDEATYGKDRGWWSSEAAKSWVEMVEANQFRGRGTKVNLLRALEDPLRAKREWYEKVIAGKSAGTRPVDMDPVSLTLGALTDEAATQALELNVDWLARTALARFKSPLAYGAAIYQRHGHGRILQEEPALIIGTIHSVKGGEADVVYIYPDISTLGAQEYYEGGQAGQDATIRQFYVALTRAKEKVVLVAALEAERAVEL